MRGIAIGRVAPMLCLALFLVGCGGASQTPADGANDKAHLSISANPPVAVAVGNVYSMKVKTTAPGDVPVGYSIQNKPSWVAFSTTTGALQGTPTSADVGTYSNVVVSASDGSSIASLPPFSITVTEPGAAAVVARPSYNTGDGFFVANGQLYDPSGQAFRIRGVNRLHWDSDSAAGIARSGANAVRWDIDFTRAPRANVALVRHRSIDARIVPVVGNWGGTCSSDPAKLSTIVATWVAQARAWTPLDRYLIVNIANEWGPADSPVWRDAYIRAIAALRRAGYLGTLLIDSGGCGQDMADLLKYSSAVFGSDPQRNVMFALHVYGGTTPATIGPHLAQLAELSRAQGTAFLVGEFGPGRNIGASGTATTPQQVIAAAEAHGIGWLAWAWDDNDLPNARSDDRWFSMTYGGPGIYVRPSDLTIFGREVVLDPRYGLQALARRASIFDRRGAS